jgi:hypothetical protein
LEYILVEVSIVLQEFRHGVGPLRIAFALVGEKIFREDTAVTSDLVIRQGAFFQDL